MRECYDTRNVRVKEFFLKLEKITFAIMVSSMLLSFCYFIFWLGAISSDLFLDFGKPIFQPLASYLNDGSTSIDIYLKTSVMSIGFIFLAQIVHIILTKVKENIISKNILEEEKQLEKEKQEMHLSYLHRFDSIQTYSICLSLDYESKNSVSLKNKMILNKAIYGKLSQFLKERDVEGKVSINDALVFTSKDFSKYDILYSGLLKELASIKMNIEKKYDYKLIPSVTTDAFGDENVYNIKKQHFEIQSFNFKNRALTTASFAQKYKYLKHSKFAGVPIGEYVYFNGNKTDTYELNVIYKNLARTLSQIT